MGDGGDGGSGDGGAGDGGAGPGDGGGAGGGGDTGAFYQGPSLDSIYAASPAESSMSASSIAEQMEELRKKTMHPLGIDAPSMNGLAGVSGLSQMYRDWNTTDPNHLTSNPRAPQMDPNYVYHPELNEVPNGQYFDPSKLATTDANGFQSILSNLTNLIHNPGYMAPEQQNGEFAPLPARWMPGSYTGPNGEQLYEDLSMFTGGHGLERGMDPSHAYDSEEAYNNYQSQIAGRYGLNPNQRYLGAAMDNPYWGDRNTLREIYGYDAANNSAKALGGYNEHSNSPWVDDWRDFTINGLSTVGMGALGAFAGPLIGEGLAAMAPAAEGATNAALIESAAGTAGYGASSASPGLLSQAITSPFTQAALTQGVTGGANAALHGGDISDILKGGSMGAIGSLVGSGVNFYNPAGSLGLDPEYARIANAAVKGGLVSGINGGNPLMGAVQAGGSSAFNTLGNSLINTGVKTMGDLFGGDAATTGGLQNPYDTGGGYEAPAGVGNYTQGPRQFEEGGSYQSPFGQGDVSMNLPQAQDSRSNSVIDGVKRLMSMGNPSGDGKSQQPGLNYGNIGAGLMDMYNRNKQSNQLGAMRNNLSGMYGPNSPYAQQLAKNLQRHDAASGRNSQVGQRQVELQARLADANSKNAPQIQRLIEAQGSARNGMMGDAYRMFAGGPNGGGLGGTLGSMYRQFGAPQGRQDSGNVDMSNQEGEYPIGLADGGPVRREPQLGSRGPVRSGGGGGLTPEAIRAAVAASAPQPSLQNIYVDPINPRSVNAHREAVQGLARGGAVRGPGGPREDLIPARLSNGEHVIDAHSVSRIGGGDNAKGQAILNQFRSNLHRK